MNQLFTDLCSRPTMLRVLHLPPESAKVDPSREIAGGRSWSKAQLRRWTGQSWL